MNGTGGTVVRLAREWQIAWELAAMPCPREDLGLPTEPCTCDTDNERLVAAERALAEAVRSSGGDPAEEGVPRGDGE